MMESSQSQVLENGLLLAIANGANTLGRLQELFPGLSREALEQILSKLEARGLVKREKRGLLFKRTEYRLTPSGLARLGEAEKMLREASERARSLVDPRTGTLTPRASQDPQASELLSLLPLMVFLGFLPQVYLAPLLAAQAIEEAGGGEGEEDFGEEAGGGEEGFEVLDIEPM